MRDTQLGSFRLVRRYRVFSSALLSYSHIELVSTGNPSVILRFRRLTAGDHAHFYPRGSLGAGSPRAKKEGYPRGCRFELPTQKCTQIYRAFLKAN